MLDDYNLKVIKILLKYLKRINIIYHIYMRKEIIIIGIILIVLVLVGIIFLFIRR